ncbi:MAG: hypothetical protein KC619_05390, partial [Myxococcales bacterium]|nr:hypothetical protein [Myxococcales bacterium]
SAWAGTVARSVADRAWVRLAPAVHLGAGDALAFLVEGPDGLDRVATGRVTDITTDAVEVELGLGERVPTGAIALHVPEPDLRLWTPPRIGGRLRLRGALDALVAFDGAPGGLAAVEAAWFLDAPVVLRAGIAPVAFGVRADRGIFAMLGYASAGLDIDWLEVSLGASVLTLNERPRGQATWAFAPLLGLRLGAEEGMSLAAQLFFPIDDVGVSLGAGRLRLTLPLVPGYHLVFRSDIGRHGVLKVDAGFRAHLQGRGERDTVTLGVFVGIGHVFYQRVCPIGDCSRVMVLAPSVGLELDWSP